MKMVQKYEEIYDIISQDTEIIIYRDNTSGKEYRQTAVNIANDFVEGDLQQIVNEMKEFQRNYNHIENASSDFIKRNDGVLKKMKSEDENLNSEILYSNLELIKKEIVELDKLTIKIKQEVDDNKKFNVTIQQIIKNISEK